jgi:hypothetical protein
LLFTYSEGEVYVFRQWLWNTHNGGTKEKKEEVRRLQPFPQPVDAALPLHMCAPLRSMFVF